MTHTNLRRVALAAALLIALIASLLSGCSPADEGGEDTGSAETTETADGTETTDGEGAATTDLDGWQVVNLTAGGMLIGRSNDRTDGTFLVLDDVFFLQAPEDEDDEVDVNTLARFGGEIHRPYPRVTIPWEAVVFVQPLLAESPALTAIADFEVDSPEPDVPSEADLGDDLKAVFTVTGDVFFGFVAVDGPTVTVSTAFLLQFKDADQAELGEVESLDDLTLVPAASPGLGSSNVVVIPLDKVLYIQTLTPDSPVVGALTAPAE